MLKNTTAPAATKIAVRDLNFYYGKFHALKGINLDIPENKVTAFIGPSGCGKSTLLRVFNRMFELYPEQRAEGQIMLDGENLLTSKEDVALLPTEMQLGDGAFERLGGRKIGHRSSGSGGPEPMLARSQSLR